MKGTIMSAMTNLLVKDDTVTTPVEFTFVPVSDTPNPNWRAAVANVPLNGQPRITLVETVLKNGGVKMSVKLESPVLETLGASGTSAGYVAPPKVAYVTTCIFTMFADGRSTSQDRANAIRMLVGVMQGASATTNTGVLAQSSAGNAFVNSTLPIVQAFVACVTPN
jgi:hypothetical protein